MIRALDHLDLVVTSLDRSLPFYRDLLGLTRESEIAGERGERVVYLSRPGEEPSGNFALGLRERQSSAHHVPYDRYAVGVHHVAFQLGSRAEVDERAAWLREHGAEIESGPAEYPQYREGYYAVFFYDPDGLKLELMYVPG
ncbi:MAG TPA: VOC family protein [Gaiellaceae bacterium]|nr:VOC family protein [Gaiellaceae bacterium]